MNPARPDRVAVAPLESVPFGDVLELLETCLGPAAVDRTEAFWRWKHELGPFGPSPGLVALAAGRPVALRVFLPWQWRSAGRRVSAVRAVDTATHPDWRRHGLFRRLTLELMESVRAQGTAFVFNTPNPTSRAGYLAMGWQDVGRLPLLVRPLRPWRMLRAHLPLRSPAGSPVAEPTHTPVLRPLGELLDEPALEAFLAAWGQGERRLHTPRDTRYLRWRYAAGPGLDYAALWQLEGASGAVAVVRRRRRRGLTEALLSELLISEDSCGERMAGALVPRLAASPDLDYLVAAASPGSPERHTLLRCGFLPLPGRRRWVVRQLAALPASIPGAIGASRAWRVSAGDLELF